MKYNGIRESAFTAKSDGRHPLLKRIRILYNEYAFGHPPIQSINYID
jgi:hypothetical protein